MFNIIISIINIIILIIIDKFRKKILLILKKTHRFNWKGKIKNYYYC
jgi:hypothetical protein